MENNMDIEKEKLIDTLNALSKQKFSPALFNTLNIIANLMNELEQRPSKAVYTRQFIHGKLVLTVDFNGLK